MKKLILAGTLAVLVTTVASSYTITHPTLQNAFSLADQAVKDIEKAQQETTKGVNFGGHAESAIDLLRKVQTELVEADKYNDAHMKKPK